MSKKTCLPKGYLDMERAEYFDLSIKVQRAVFIAMRGIISYNTQHAMELIKMASPITPVDWIIACKNVYAKCERCKGTGTYSWGACVNGRMTNSGSCNRCGGKGYMKFDDMRRNKAYDNHAICRAFAN